GTRKMKRLRREINIFSLSALDLFAAAMGTFILLTVLLFPYYLKNAEIVEKMSALRQELEKTQTNLAQTQQQLQECTTQREQCETQRTQLQERIQECQAQQSNLKGQISTLQQEIKNCQEKLKQTFLAIIMKWTTNRQDVDLHLIDTEGNEFYFERHNRNRAHFRNSSAELSVDTTKGPGIEIWENPRAKPGHYKLYANLYARHGNSKNPLVKSTVYYRDGAKKLREITLTQEKQKQLIAIIEVNTEGDVVVR
ncbi:hypothetical protein QUF54_07240, partial [Candidatus Marithioploca araucensis]|nr:hypothetical protein [Candidatus Marithioploca araucensis]